MKLRAAGFLLKHRVSKKKKPPPAMSAHACTIVRSRLGVPLNNLFIFETANEREYSLILKFAFISVHSRFVIWASYLSENL
ncbi:hypothetical protein DCC62_29690 [candidate division KSB1 bacterium]|nr:MAG: hypothetical protein DCC62_29690 [candidate division KSB1 bacterium]